MLIRTFKQYAQAFNTEPLTVIVTLDEEEIFNGQVDTIDNISPDMTKVAWPGPLLCTWTNNIDFVGSRSMKVEVIGEGLGFLLLTSTHANYVCVEKSLVPYVTVPGGPDIYNGFYSQKLDGFDAHDPYTDVKINGILQVAEHSPECTGQWSWMITPGSVFTATLNVNKARYPDDI
jgi:hypothetical protein